MSTQIRFRDLFPASCAVLLLICAGCNQEEAAEKLSEAEANAEKAAESLADNADEAMEKGKEMASEAGEKGKELASELGEKAMGFLNPLKEKLGGLDSLKESPEKLKVAVTELITSIEEKAEGITLPESVSTTLASVKEQLVALKEYLEGEYEQANIDERVQKIMESVKSGLGMSEG